MLPGNSHIVLQSMQLPFQSMRQADDLYCNGFSNGIFCQIGDAISPLTTLCKDLTPGKKFPFFSNFHTYFNISFITSGSSKYLWFPFRQFSFSIPESLYIF